MWRVQQLAAQVFEPSVQVVAAPLGQVSVQSLQRQVDEPEHVMVQPPPPHDSTQLDESEHVIWLFAPSVTSQRVEPEQVTCDDAPAESVHVELSAQVCVVEPVTLAEHVELPEHAQFAVPIEVSVQVTAPAQVALQLPVVHVDAHEPLMQPHD
ncbi:MAG: hypothetical protein JNM17_19765 [Archangium sp.]|nr:hypothetical protein [Archangium sp.]